MYSETHKLAVVQVALEDNEVAVAQVQEEIGRLAGQAPEGVARGPEGVLGIDPLSFALVLLPALAHLSQRGNLIIVGVREQRAVGHGIEEPVPVLARHVRDEPSKALAVEVNLVCNAALDQPVGCRVAMTCQ